MSNRRVTSSSARTAGLPSTVFVLAAEEIAFREVLLQHNNVANEGS